VVCKRSWAS